MATCPTDEVLAAWSAGALHGDELQVVDAHAAQCAACRGLAVMLAGVTSQPGREGLGAEGAMVDRYRILGAIGQGAMGVVLRGHDPVLDREVAIKMVGPSAGTREQRERMLVEAKTLARIDHPNVVRVFDAGEIGDEVFVAMELVGGTTLARWLAGSPRSLAERIQVLVGVGGGIAAVHAAGLVHRDIKPDNILVRDTGTAVLIDFGLARGSEAGDAHALGSGIAGTPRFIAPELLAGAKATALSDQFAWWTVVDDTLRDAELPGRRRRALDQAIARGRSDDPTARFPTMHDAIAALAPVRQRPQWPIVVGIAAVLGALVVGGALLRRPAVEDPCAATSTREWAYRRPAIASHLALAGAAVPSVLAALDHRSATTAALHTASCTASTGADVEQRSRAQRSLLCADETWRDTTRIFAGLTSSSRQDVRAAVDELIQVLPIERCSAGAMPAIAAPPRADKLAAARALETELREIRLSTELAIPPRLARLRALEPRVHALEHPQSEAVWHADLADLLSAQGDYDGAGRELETSIRLAETAGDDDIRIRGLINRLRLAMQTGQADTTAIESAAEAAAARLGNPAITAQLHLSVGFVRFGRGDLQGAVAILQTAQREIDSVAIDAHAQQVLIAQNLAAMQQTTGDLAGAQATFDRGYALAVRRYGERARATSIMRGARATNFMYAGDIAKARPELATVAEDLEHALGDHDAQVVQVRSYLCEADLGMNAPAAQESCDLALARAKLAFGPQHPQIVWQLGLVGQQRLAANRAEEAIPLFEQALVITEHGAVSPSDRPIAQGYLALALHALGRDSKRATTLARAAASALHGQADKREMLAKLAAAFP